MNKKDFVAITIRTALAIMIIFSIVVTYYVMVVKKNYEIFTNPDGPETEDYFLELSI